MDERDFSGVWWEFSLRLALRALSCRAVTYSYVITAATFLDFVQSSGSLLVI